MNNPKNILSLDAGGTNLVFSSIMNGEVKNEYSLPTASADIDEFLRKLIKGFKEVINLSGEKADAISFCFPGPADYEAGIIGDLENLPFFRGGVPLKNMLENEFKIPVFINNDGDLFTLGEALSGILPEVNDKLTKNNNPKRYSNLLGLTLGTGFGSGMVNNGNLWIGDNSAGAEINRMPNLKNPKQTSEEIISRRGVKNLYRQYASNDIKNSPEPYDIYKIAKGELDGNKDAAIKTWEVFGEVLGDAASNAVTLTDSIIVVGGGLSGASELFLPKAIEVMNSKFEKPCGGELQRLETYAYNLNNEECLADFLMNESTEIKVPYSNQLVNYNNIKKIGIGVSTLGTSKAVAMGAWHFALRSLQ